MTLGALADTAPVTLVDRLARVRMSYLRGLAAFAQFGDGWTRRVTDVQQAARQMTG